MIDLLMVEKFWNWFEREHNSFGPRFNNKRLISDLDKYVSDLGPFSWELGPGNNKERMFVISPNGDISRLPDTESIIALAPNLENWEFYATKQKKNSGFKFKFDYEEKKQTVDAKDWSYCLFEIDDNYYDINIIATNIMLYDTITQVMIVEILLDNILGEKLRIQSFEFIEVNSNADDIAINKFTNIQYLEQHLKSLRM